MKALQMACDLQRKLTPPGGFRPSCAGCPATVECPLRRQCELGALRPPKLHLVRDEAPLVAVDRAGR